MILIVSESIRRKKKKNKEMLRKYWRLVFPKDYADLMVAGHIDENLTKIASQRLKKEDLVGRLSQADNGFVYVNISNNFIHGFFPLINEDGVEKPPYFGKGKGKVGAHISAISDKELERGVEIKEIGEEIPFFIKGVYSTKPEGWSGMERVWFVSVDCPRLKEIRKKYKLAPTYKDKGHDFHITVGVKKR